MKPPSVGGAKRRKRSCSGSRSSLGEVLELLGTVWDAPGSLFWELAVPSATQSSLVTWRMNSSLSQVFIVSFFFSTQQSSLEGSRRRTAALWVSAVAKAINYLFLHWLDGTVRHGFLPSSQLPSPRILPSQVLRFHPPLSGVVQLECRRCSHTSQAGLPHRLHGRSCMASKRTHGTSLSRSFVSQTVSCLLIFRNTNGVSNQWKSGHLRHRSDTSWPQMRSGAKSSSVACDSALWTLSMKCIFPVT